MSSTSWESVGKWYSKAVGKEGHYYHQQVVVPKTLEVIGSKPKGSVLDLACGQGVLGRQLLKERSYLGLDVSKSLVETARKLDAFPTHTYEVQDVTKPLSLPPPFKNNSFDFAVCLLALQNIKSPIKLFENAHNSLKKSGLLFFVINHPCFRIPRQSSWGIDQDKKIQYRRMDQYLSPLKIPIQAHPSKGKNSPSTLSFHYPLSSYSTWLKSSGFAILELEELCSNKTSTGKAAKMENRAREEFPLFLAVSALKL